MPNTADVVHAATVAVCLLITPSIVTIMVNLSKHTLSEEARDSYTKLINLAVGSGVAALALYYPSLFAVVALGAGVAQITETAFQKKKGSTVAVDVSRETITTTNTVGTPPETQETTTTTSSMSVDVLASLSQPTATVSHNAGVWNMTTTGADGSVIHATSEDNHPLEKRESDGQ